MTDDRPPCVECRHHALHRPSFLSAAAPHSDVCTHPSALRLNDGAAWHVNLARQRCAGKRWARK